MPTHIDEYLCDVCSKPYDAYWAAEWCERSHDDKEAA